MLFFTVSLKEAKEAKKMFEKVDFIQIDYSKIYGNVEFVHSSDVTSVNLVFVSDKIINNSDHFRIKCLSYSKISAILCFFLFSVFTLFYLILENMLTNACEKNSFSLLYWTQL